jgi:hypothetical protein
MSIKPEVIRGTPGLHAEEGDFFVRRDPRGWQVCRWHNRQGWDVGEPTATEEEAYELAHRACQAVRESDDRAWARAQGSDPDVAGFMARDWDADDASMQLRDDVERELIEAWRAVPVHRAAWCRGILLAVLREMSARN